jgi:hypothetical protein
MKERRSELCLSCAKTRKPGRCREFEAVQGRGSFVHANGRQADHAVVEIIGLVCAANSQRFAIADN